MWSPTHIKVTIRAARNLLCKGKNNTNNCFVTIVLGKEKYQTSVKEKSESNVAWNEECELKIPDKGNSAELILTCLHRNNLGIDEFLGQVTLPLRDMDAYDRPRAKWCKLESKPGKEKKNKERGELDVLIAFTVQSGSLTDLSKKEKHKSSIGQLASSVGGSLLSLGQIEKRKGIKKIAKKFGSKLHLNGKSKKEADLDEMSYNGSFASIGTPNRTRVPDSEDEDEFQFDKLSQKSSVSSLNLRGERDSLQAPNTNYMPKNPSPLLGSAGKGSVGKELHLQQYQQQHSRYDGSDNLSVDPEMEKIENEISIRARAPPPPHKPPRTPQQTRLDAAERNSNTELDEWESKLYAKNLEVGSSDSLKRRSWEPIAVPLPTTNEEEHKVQLYEHTKEDEMLRIHTRPQATLPPLAETKTPETLSESSSSLTDSEDEAVVPPAVVTAPAAIPPKVELTKKQEIEKPIENKPRPRDLSFLSKDFRKDSLLSPDANEFNRFNESFAKFEQINGAKIYDIEEETNNFIQNESKNSSFFTPMPQPKPRPRVIGSSLNEDEEEVENTSTAISEQKDDEQKRRQRAEEDARLEAELQANEKLLQEEEAAFQKELNEREEEKRREAKRIEEDLKILNFSKRLVSPKAETKLPQKTETMENSTENATAKQNAAAVEMSNPRIEDAYLTAKSHKREKQIVSSNSVANAGPRAGERIIIGHEKSSSQADRRAEISAALAKKYDGKSREELMLIANGMENEALVQRQRVKELEDYLDNLLLRVMETHPKILQNPYSRTTSAKSG